MIRRCFRKRICVIIIFSVALILALAAYRYRNYLQYIEYYGTRVLDKSAIFILNRQKVIVDIPSEIDPSDISIEWNALLYGSPPENREIFNGSVKQKKIPFGFGSHGFSIYYKEELIEAAGHFVVSEHGYHDYLFDFRRQGEEVFVSFKAIGPDSLTYKEWDDMYFWTKGPLYSSELSPPLILVSDSSSIDNTIDFTLRSSDLQRMVLPGIDTVVKKVSVAVGDDIISVKSLKTRGTSSLMYARKNYNVKLENAAWFVNDQGEIRRMNSFSLLSLAMDQHYVRTILAHEILRELGLMNMFHSYCEVKMNEETQGIYFLVENPKQHMLDSLNASIHIRRGFEYSILSDERPYNKSKIEFEANEFLSSGEVDEYLDQYLRIHRIINEIKGEQLYEALDEIMDLKTYMRLMAFNYIVCNHDYTDEIYFYIDDRSNMPQYKFLPWDFDDIFGNSPHEGWKKRNESLGDKLVFSAENELDLMIASDSFLYEKYMDELSDIINALDTNILNNIFQGAYDELYPYYSKPEIIGLSELDAYPTPYTRQDLEFQIAGIHSYLKQRLHAIHSKLQSGR